MKSKLTAGWRDKTRPEDDYYCTPTWIVRAALQEVGFSYSNVLDPGAGTGVLGKQAEEWKVENLGEEHRPPVTAVELSADRCAEHPDHWESVNANFLSWAENHDKRYDLILVNPPFKHWLEFANACLRLRGHAGILIMLANQGILAGQARYSWWKNNQPSDIYQSPKRPKFRKSATDARDYVWVKWGRGNPIHTRFHWLDINQGTKLNLPKRG